MKVSAQYLVRNGKSNSAFEIRDVEVTSPQNNEVQIEVKASGLNFADVMARTGIYNDCPPLPTILGYEVSGIVTKAGEDVEHVVPGDRVMALTRFGGYAQVVNADVRAVVKLDDTVEFAEATALGTQYITAHYAAAHMANIYPGEKLLIHACAGGVGTALVQYALYKNCTIFGTAGSSEKIDRLISMGVQHPINYRKEDYLESAQEILNGERLDATFNPIGGDYIKKDLKLLTAGGRLVLYGASTMMEAKNPISKLFKGLSFGFYHPAPFMLKSKSLIGINMLRMAEYRPERLQIVLKEVMELAAKKIYKPVIGACFPFEQVADAHELLESRKSHGKVVLMH